MSKLYVPPHGARPTDVDTAIAVLGGSARAELLRFLGRQPASYLGQITKGIPGLTQSACIRHLRALEEAGVVVADLPPEERKGRSPRYTVAEHRLEQLVDAWMCYALRPDARREDEPHAT